MGHVYSLGAVKPWVRSAAQEVGDKFDIGTIYGIGARANVSDHPIGLATDFMVYKDRAKGDQVAAYLKANWQRLDIKYIIWYQRIDNGGGWEPMEDRGGATANHQDHVHTSYQAQAGAGQAYNGGTDSTTDTAGSDGGTTAFVAALTSASTWIRALMFIAGAVILAVMTWRVISQNA
jgi:hypothetical protein